MFLGRRLFFVESLLILANKRLRGEYNIHRIWCYPFMNHLVFLWFHKVHRVVKGDWRYIFFSGSTRSLLKMKADSYWLAVIWFNSEVWIERFDPCQIALANGQYRKWWDMDSSFSWHKGHVLLVGIPLLFKTNFTSKLLWRSFQIKVIILIGSLIFQMTFHTHS